MFKKAVYKYHTYAGTETEPEKVTSDFLQDMANCKPVNVTSNKTRVFAWFKDCKYTVMYTLPIEYKKYFTEV